MRFVADHFMRDFYGAYEFMISEVYFVGGGDSVFLVVILIVIFSS